MITILRTNSKHKDFIYLVEKLDAYLKLTDGEEHDFYNQFNNIDVLQHTVIAYNNNQPLGCGAFKVFNNKSVEVKRMFTSLESRGQGIATLVLQALEDWSKELNYSSCILETGIRQLEAVQFYKKNNYNVISNYGQYQGIENSLCFKKELNSL